MNNTIIFDMDGVLVDTTKYVWKSFNILLEDQGIQFSNEDIKKYLGMSLQDKFKEWNEKFGVEIPNLDNFSRQLTDIELKLMRDELKKNKDLEKLLKELKENNFSLAISTSSKKERAKRVLEAAQISIDYFDIIVTAEDASTHKPDPEIYLKTIERLQTNPENCIVFEDSIAGVKAAKNAGAKVIGIKNPYQDEMELEKYSNKVIEKFKDISIENIKYL